VSGAGHQRHSTSLRIVATCAPGLEPLLADELRSLGLTGVEPTRSAVRFQGGWTDVWRANYWLRTANRVLIEIATFPAATSEELYGGAAALIPQRGRAASRTPAVAVEDLLVPGRTFAVSATSSRSRLRDTRWIALKVKDAIADAQRARFRRRADVDPRRPDVPLRVWLHDDRATVLLDSSREPLDHRGYRKVSGTAPLREQLAAALVLASGWDGAGPVVDPMCGTGTLLVEAAWIALGRAPGSLREGWVFEDWPGFDARAFARVRSGGAPAGVTPPAALRLHGRDLSTDAIRAARLNLEAAGLAELADLEVADGFAFEPPATPGLVLMNPAYGERLETTDDEWKRIGDLLKQRYAGWRSVLIAGEPSFGKHVGLRPRRRIPVKNGPIDAKILVLDLYAGRAAPADP
jgi:putative N6-adenine-specific DNA methylase